MFSEIAVHNNITNLSPEPVRKTADMLHCQTWFRGKNHNCIFWGSVNLYWQNLLCMKTLNLQYLPYISKCKVAWIYIFWIWPVTSLILHFRCPKTVWYAFIECLRNAVPADIYQGKRRKKKKKKKKIWQPKDSPCLNIRSDYVNCIRELSFAVLKWKTCLWQCFHWEKKKCTVNRACGAQLIVDLLENNGVWRM